MADEYPGAIEDALFELRSAATDYDVMMSAEGFYRAIAAIRRDQAEKDAARAAYGAANAILDQFTPSSALANGEPDER